MKKIGAFVFLVSAVTVATAADWTPWSPPGSGMIGVGYTHDDEGALIILCDPKQRIISIILNESRAKWTAQTPMKVITRSDSGDEYTANGMTLGPTQLAIGQEATFSLSTMGKAKGFFIVGNGQYARVFPALNFRSAVEPVLQACGDHW